MKATTLDQMATTPTYMTTLGRRLQDGRCRSTMDGGGVWLYRVVPLAPTRDAKDTEDLLRAMAPVYKAFEELSKMVSSSSKRRFIARSNYRRIHTLLVNIPEYFHLPWDQELSAFLNEEFADESTDRRFLLFGVELKDKIGGGGGWRDRIDSMRAFLTDHEIPIGDYDEDYDRVDAALHRAGLVPAKEMHFRVADAYWNKGETPNAATLTHAEHIHVFHTPDAMRQADIIGVENCETLEGIPGQSAVSYATVTDFEFEYEAPTDQVVQWVSALVEEDALAVSIRGLIEPRRVTRDELRRQKSAIIKDIAERVKNGKMDRAEQSQMLEKISQAEAEYATDHANPTLMDASVIVCFSGIKDIEAFNSSTQPIQLAPMTLRQPGAMAETWLCSRVTQNPKLHDIPSQVVAASGITGLSYAGDRTGALVGLSERDRQPCLLDPRAASRGSDLPIMIVAAATGSGKTMLMLHLADQFARMNYPGVMIDLGKEGSDHSAVVKNFGGQVWTLDNVQGSDGIFDPIHFMIDWDAAPDELRKQQAVAIALATQTLLRIESMWGERFKAIEAELGPALRYGVVERGARCIGEALDYALDKKGDFTTIEEIRRYAINAAEASPNMSAIIGRSPEAETLTVGNGVTLITLGNANLDLPREGQQPSNLSEESALALVRLMVYGATSALRVKGGGFVFLDEAWTFLGAGSSEVERLGRVAREQRVFPGLFTQRVTDATSAGLAGYISRVLIGLMTDQDEARAACELARMDPDKYVSRLMEPGTTGGDSESGEQPNPKSLKAQEDPETGAVTRGAIFYYKDRHQRAVPVEVVLSDSFLDRASTTPEAKDARAAQAAA